MVNNRPASGGLTLCDQTTNTGVRRRSRVGSGGSSDRLGGLRPRPEQHESPGSSELSRHLSVAGDTIVPRVPCAELIDEPRQVHHELLVRRGDREPATHRPVFSARHGVWERASRTPVVASASPTPPRIRDIRVAAADRPSCSFWIAAIAANSSTRRRRDACDSTVGGFEDLNLCQRQPGSRGRQWDRQRSGCRNQSHGRRFLWELSNTNAELQLLAPGPIGPDGGRTGYSIGGSSPDTVVVVARDRATDRRQGQTALPRRSTPPVKRRCRDGKPPSD